MRIAREGDRIILDGRADLRLTKHPEALRVDGFDTGAPLTICNHYAYRVDPTPRGRWNATLAALRFIWAAPPDAGTQP